MKCLKRSVRVLYINDDEDDALIFEETMREAGFENTLTFIPKEGIEALSHLRALPDPPDVVVLDTKLPGMEGHEVLREIRSSELFRHMPIILVTGSVGYLEMLKDRYPGLKVDGVLVKPVSVNSLQEVLQPFSSCVEEA